MVSVWWLGLVTLVYVPVRFLYDMILSCWWMLNGTRKRRLQSRLPENYNFSAQVLDVQWRGSTFFGALLDGKPPQSCHFFLTHNSFVDPAVVLKDTVSLYYFTKEEATFVVVDKHVDVTSLTTNSFLKDAQTKHAKQLIVMPLGSFHKIAQTVGLPSGKVVFVGNTSRCGSTLLVQIFQEMKQVLALSEPYVLEIVVDMLREFPREHCKKLLRSCISLLCKPQSGASFEAYILKPGSLTSRLHLLFQESLPDVSHLFMYRDCIPASRSAAQLFATLSWYQLMHILPYIFPKKKVAEVLYRNETFDEDVELEHFSTLPFALSFCTWCKACKHFFDAREMGVEIATLKYEHLLQDPKGTMRKVLAYLALPDEWAEVTEDGMRLDSHRNGVTCLTGKRTEIVITDGDKTCVNQMLVRYGIPTLDEPCLLLGTISA